MPLFSIIIPTKNRSSLLKDAIESVLNQKHQDFELIIVDDHSDDDTKVVIHSFNDSRIIYNLNTSIERSAARNTGIITAKGDYICFLDDDDYYTENYLIDYYNYLSQHIFPKDVILRTGFLKKFENGKEKKSEMYDEKKHKNAVRFAAYNMCGVWTLCIPKVLLDDNKFDERFPHWQDTHLILRLLNNSTLIQLNNYNYVYILHKAMGSKTAFDKEIIESRCELNISAIKDLFQENPSIKNWLPKSVESFLISEKYIQYAINELKFNKRRNIYLKLFANSLKCGFHLSLSRYYIIFFIRLLRFDNV